MQYKAKLLFEIQIDGFSMRYLIEIENLKNYNHLMS